VNFKPGLFTLLLCGAGFLVNADTLYIQTSSAGPYVFSDGSSFAVNGVNDTPPALTLNGASVTSELYAVTTLTVTGGTKSTSNKTLTDDIALVQDNSITQYTGLFPFYQVFTETASGNTATFSVAAGAPITIHLINGDYLTITPLANSSVTAGSIVDATYALTSSPPVPEPASMLIVGAGLFALAIIGRKLRLSQQRLIEQFHHGSHRLKVFDDLCL
jgi:hypothetical protein